MGWIEVLSPGLLTTVQDGGRPGFEQFGVPCAGAMDPFAFRAGNLLVGNNGGEAGLEITLLGPALRFCQEARIAVTGGDLGACINGQPAPLWQTLQLQAGDELSFAGARKGCRAYLAVAGGIEVPAVMGSRATYLRARLGGLEGRALQRGDRLPVGRAGAPVWGRLEEGEIPPFGAPVLTVRVVLGPQQDYFSPKGLETFLSEEYLLTNECDRMGYRLDGASIAHQKGADIVSDGIFFGAIQVPGHGKPIVMMADCQTTGGYAKIAGVIGADLPLLAQAKPGDRVHFCAVELSQAHQALALQEGWLRQAASRLCRVLPGQGAFRVQVGGKDYFLTVEPL